MDVPSVYTQFFLPGDVVELRALGLSGKNSAWEGFAGGNAGIVSGYFNDGDKLAAAAAALDRAGARGVYFTVNPCMPALISRAANRLICPKKDAITSDQHIDRLRWFLVDLDAWLLDGSRRPSGISASNEEMAAVRIKAEEVAKYLEEEIGFARALRAMSGNGYHLNYRLPDLPNDDEHKTLIRDAMAALAEKFGKVTIDVSVVNPARIWKYYSTTGRKGDSTPDRPHRVSYIHPDQPALLSDLPVTDIETLKKYASSIATMTTPAAGSVQGTPPPAASQPAADKPAPPSPVPHASSSSGTQRVMKKNELGPLDMDKYLSHFGIAYDVKEINDSKRGPAMSYRLERCVFNPDHGPNEASIIVPEKGAFLYQCFHASCKGMTWKDAKRQISGGKNLAEFCRGYDPNWEPPRETGTGLMAALPTPMTNAEALKNGIGGGPPVQQPTEVDPREFYEQKGKRPVFVPFYLAKYLAAYLHPICHTSGVFYHYAAGVWKEFSKTEITQICVHAMKEQIQAAWIEAVTKILSGLVNREEREWPDNPLLLNVKNGMLNIESRELLPHDPIYGSRTQLPVNYLPVDVKGSARWVKFLEEIFPDDPAYDKRGILMQFFGYCLLRDARFQKALFLYGTGANGKSTVLDVLMAMVGAENTSSLTLQDLSKQFRAHFLQHKLINISTETETRDPLTTSTFKAVVDGSPLTAERKYGEAFQYRPYAKWIVAMNEAPVIPDKSYGFGRRVMVLNFNKRFEADEIKDRMAEYLIEEIDAIFSSWAVEGLAMLLKNGKFRVGNCVQDDTDRLMENMNPLLIFVSECCEIDDDPDRDRYELSKVLWLAYTEWCQEGKNRSMGRNNFFEQLQSTFTRVRKTRKEIKSRNDDGEEVKSHISVFTGIRLTTPGQAYAERGQQRSEKFFDKKSY